jgi:hypothetical protein
VTNINSDVLTADVRVFTAEPWRARLGAFSPRCGFLGTGVLGAGGGTEPCVVVRSVPRVRVVPAPQSAPKAQLGQPNNYIHMTSVYAVGEGASGPPPHREPA